jgi:hypothetical protein
MPRSGLDKAARLATESPYYNPRPIRYEDILMLLEDAFEGVKPGTRSMAATA